MAVYDIKDSVSMCKTSKACVNTGKTKKMQVIIPELWHSCVLFLAGLSIFIFMSVN